jgi:hypothetical protein
MLFTKSSAAAVLGFAASASAHMIMGTPKPYGNPSNSPLNGDGSDFPCKLLTPDFSSATSMALGSTQPLNFIGGATHGGGSCQISITYDNPPTKNSVWKVITSIEGGCPAKNAAGNIGSSASTPAPDQYSFTMPVNIPTGKAVLAWTWFNKIGNREMYMNCAAINIGGGSSKRDEEAAGNATMLFERDISAYNALPDMFTANIKNIGNDACTTFEGIDTLFPNPGSVISKPGAMPNYGNPSTGCPSANKAGAVAASAPAASSPAAASPKVSTTSKPAAVVATSKPAQGGVFVTVPPSSTASKAAAVPAASPAKSATTPAAASPKATTLATQAVASPKPSAQASAASVAKSSVQAAVSAFKSSTSVAGAAATPAAGTTVSQRLTPGAACSSEGMWNCLGTSYQRCAAGTWTVAMPMAPGTKCTVGQSMNLIIGFASKKRDVEVQEVQNKARSVRFSGSHARRHAARHFSS